MAFSFLNMKGVISFSLFFFFLLSCSTGELITDLPGQPNGVSFKQYSGYITTDAQDGRALFYYFVEAESKDPLSRPLTLWFNGGPGCSSVGFGAFLEHGPFKPGKDGQLIKNEHSWNRESNMLYVDTPLGVGFSYSNTSSNYAHWNDTMTAEDNLRFLLNWLEEFPQYKDSDLYLTGESYAGHYVPQLAALLLEYNKKQNNKPIKLKGMALGNPLLDIDISVQAGDFIWSHGAISDATLELHRTVCDFARYYREFAHGNLSKECNDTIGTINKELGTDPANLLWTRCLSSSISTNSTNNLDQFFSKGILATIHEKLAGRAGRSGDPCLGDYIYAYILNPQVQKALHANTTHLPFKWFFCTGPQGGGPLVYQEDNQLMNLIPMVSDLIRDGIALMLFSGDQDTKIPLTQTRIIANMIAQNLKLVPLTKYAIWPNQDQVGGWGQSFGVVQNGKNVTYLTFATVRGAAHEVAFTSPSEALTLFKTFLSGSILPQT